MLPETMPEWKHEDDGGRGKHRDYAVAIVEGMRRCIRKTPNWAKLYNIRQEKSENPAAFYERLCNTCKRYTDLDPEDANGKRVLIPLFIGQSYEDIRKKLQKLEGALGKNIEELLEIAMKVYDRRDDEERKKKARVLALALREGNEEKGGKAKGRSGPPSKGKGKGPRLGRNQCAICKEEGHWKNECPRRQGREYKDRGGRRTQRPLLAAQAASLDPTVKIKVEGRPIEALIDTGATLSLLPLNKAPRGRAQGRAIVQGIEGQTTALEKTLPLLVKVGDQQISHQFICSPSCPIALLGRDILTKLQAEISFEDGKMEVRIPKQQTSNYQMALISARNHSSECQESGESQLPGVNSEASSEVGPIHDCIEVLQQETKPRSDLSDLPWPNPDVEGYVDGSSYVVNGKRFTGAAVVIKDKGIHKFKLSPNLSAQAAELVALIEALRLGAGKTLNLYTDSRYAYMVVHAHGTLWRERGFITASGQKIAHGSLIKMLLEALMLPLRVAVIHVRAHGKAPEAEQRRYNQLADQAAKEAARDGALWLLMVQDTEAKTPPPQYTAEEIGQAQAAGGRQLHRYAAPFQALPLDQTVHPFRIGDQVLIKKWKCDPLTPRWDSPHTVSLISQAAVKILGSDKWTHHTRVKRFLTPNLEADSTEEDISPLSTPAPEARGGTGEDTVWEYQGLDGLKGLFKKKR
ncbi:uncharacterized protein LOC123346638 [Mauremys mutica]|uniref:uncharacterized protein LOC123346638 n=1 Tax=Mauremys mutica TaxID=74926 RepID=UPI001D16C627|nr:uncharacterized protein LOC123346638 [Mauremys mutica]